MSKQHKKAICFFKKKKQIANKDIPPQEGK